MARLKAEKSTYGSLSNAFNTVTEIVKNNTDYLSTVGDLTFATLM